MSSVEPLVFLAGINKLGVDDDDWTLTGEGADGDGRVFRSTITFEQPFRMQPIVHLGLVGFDISNADAARVRLRCENVSASEFEVVVETWRGSQVYSVEISWLAIGT